MAQTMYAVTTLRKQSFKWAGNYDHFLSEWNRLSLAWTKKQRYLTAAYHSLLPKISEEYEVCAALRADSSSSYLGICSGLSTNPGDNNILDLWVLKMLRQFWRWNGHLIQSPRQSPFPAMFLLHLVLTAEGEELRPNEKYPRFSSHDHAELTAEANAERAGTWASSMYLCNLYTIKFNQFNSVVQVL